MGVVYLLNLSRIDLMRHSDDIVIQVLQALHEGHSVSHVARHFNVSRPTVIRWRDNNGRRKQNQMGPSRRMSVGKQLIPEISRIMAENVGNLDKSTRHLTASRMYGLLKAPTSPVCDLSFSQRTVERVMVELRPSFEAALQRSYLQLNAEPASAQVDFGSVHMFCGTEETLMDILVCSLPYSNMRFAWLLPAQNFECFAEGLTQIFNVIGGVPKYIRFDNAKILVSQVLRTDAIKDLSPEERDRLDISKDRDGKLRVLTPAYKSFRNYYAFKDEFCSPAAGYEKGSVENAVGFYKRQIFSPPPVFDGDFKAFNKMLVDFAFEKGKALRPKTNSTCLEMFKREQSHFLPLPSEPYEAFVFKKVVPNNNGFVNYDKNQYQVRIHSKGSQIYLKATWNSIEFYTCSLASDEVFDFDSEKPIPLSALMPEYTLLNSYTRDYSYRKSSFVDWYSIFELTCVKPRSLRYSMFAKVWPKDAIDFLCSYQSSERKIILRALKTHLTDNKIEPVTQVLTSCLFKINFKHLPAEEVATLIRKHGEVAPDDMDRIDLPSFMDPERDAINLTNYDFFSSGDED